jgi:hypothetical protein
MDPMGKEQCRVWRHVPQNNFLSSHISHVSLWFFLHISLNIFKSDSHFPSSTKQLMHCLLYFYMFFF